MSETPQPVVIIAHGGENMEKNNSSATGQPQASNSANSRAIVAARHLPHVDRTQAQKHSTMPAESKEVSLPICKLIVNVLLLLLCFVPVIVFKAAVNPFQRGIYCDDETIRYPYRESTISTGVLIVFFGGLPIIVISIFEGFRLYIERPLNNELPAYKVGTHYVHRYLVRLYVFIGYFFLGAAFCQTLTDIAKYSVGRPRPHFVAVCQPDWGRANCTGHQYVDPVVCTGTNEHLKKEARLSFLSGHASFSFYTMIFTALYIEARVYWHLYSPLGKPIMQFIGLLLAAGCAYSRISDYKHHWSDVFAGFILGTTVAIVFSIFVAKLFKRRERPFLDHSAPERGSIFWDGRTKQSGRDDMVPLNPIHSPSDSNKERQTVAV